MIDVFISYARSDREQALSLARFLKERGYSVLWDWDFFGCEDLKGAIHDAIGSVAKVIVLWSEHSTGFAVVLGEAREARKQGKLIPVSLDGSSPPRAFADLPTISLLKPAGLDEVIAAIERRPPPDIPVQQALLRKFGHVLTGSAMAFGLAMAGVAFWLNLPPPRPLGEGTLRVAGEVPAQSPAVAGVEEAPKEKAPGPEKVVLRMALGACVFKDPTGEPLNVHAAPQGAVVSTLANDRVVLIAESKSDSQGQQWVLVENNENGERLGWVTRNSISCP